ncbi:MAG: hypothetical protein HY964_00775, partial [Ignavibacteriales bacterium]|nr:hypothetical protein [Ignavibacteriales bacterium]
MKKSWLYLSIFILSVLFISASDLFSQTPASITWNLTADANVSTTTGNIVGQTQTLSNLMVQNYTTNTAQRTSPDGAGTWPASEISENSTRYMQFMVSPTTLNSFYVNSISFYLYVNSGSYMRANVYYSSDPTFSTRTQIGSTFSLSSTVPTSPNVNATPNITIPDGGGLYIRVYPWYTSTNNTTKHVLTKIVTVSGTTTGAGPEIAVSLSLLPNFIQTLGVPSAEQTYALSGNNLTNDVMVSPPLGYEISSDSGNSWISNPSSLTLPQSSGIIIGQPITISARLNGSSATLYSGDIAHTSVNATTKNVAVNGTTLAVEPTTQSNITFGTVTGNSIVVNFTGGNGDRRVLVARSSNSVNWTPTDGIPVSGVNNDFSLATDQAGGNKIVYDGTGSTVTVSNLSSNTVYYFAVYEYNVGIGNTQNYNIVSPGTGNQTTLTMTALQVDPSSISFGSIEVNGTSEEKTYLLSGDLLSPTTGSITVNAPSGYEVSLTSGSGFNSFIVVPYSSGSLSATTVYVRFKPTIVQIYSGNISNSGGGATTQNVSVVGTGAAPAAPNEFQAEEGILNSAYILTQHAGYTGSGYVDIANKTGASLEITFRRSTASSDNLDVYYALGSSSRAYSIVLNGSVVGSLTFTGTTTWTNWSKVSMVIPFQAGVNRLKFVATTNTSENANIDRIVIGGQTATPVFKLTLTKSGAGTVSATPSSADSMYDVGTIVTLNATPSGGSFFYRWSGNDQSSSNPFQITMNAHKTEVAVMPASPGFGAFQYEATPKGFASIGAFTYSNGTTGGSGVGASVVYVTNSDDLGNILLRRQDLDHIFNFPPLTIYVIGTLTPGSVVTNMCDVKRVYDISIIGVGVDAVISGFGFNIVEAKNIIVRNIKFQNSAIDGITVSANDIEGTGNHIWIDHCDFTNAYDGALDVTHTASYVTLSWNHFYNHDKTCLMGHSDTQTSDVAMKVTYHHNYFDGTGQRHPRIRYGKAHIFNNYYRNNVLYGVSSNLEADVLVEGNYFLDVPIPTETSRDGSPPGDLVQRSNIFAGTTGIPGTRGTAFEPSAFYNYSVDSASNIPAMLTSYGGSGKYDFSSGEQTVNYYSLTVNATHGVVSKSPDQLSYENNTSVLLTAIADAGYSFDNWSGDLTGSVNPASIIMNGNKTVTANFAINQFVITATAGANGTISPSGSVTVDQGANQHFDITPNSGYYIQDLLVDAIHVDSTTSYTFYNVQGNHSIAASFALNPVDQFSIAITAVNGSVTKNPNQQLYNTGTSVQLTAVPAMGYHFTNWSGDLTGATNPETILMNSNKNVTANFAINQYSLNIIANNGSVDLNPPGGTYNLGTKVYLTANPNSGFYFLNWSGDLSSSNNPDSIIINGDKTITANFGGVASIAGDYRTHQTGNWSDVDSWERYDGTIWITPAPIAPTSSDGVINILNGHIISLNTSVAVDQVTINPTANLTVLAGNVLTVADGADSVDMVVKGTLNNFGTVTSTGRVSFEATGLYVHSVPAGAGSVPLSTWRDGSTCRIDSGAASSPTGIQTQSLYNLIWNASNQGANGGPNLPNGYVLSGSLTVLNSKGLQFRITNLTAGETKNIYIRGDVNVNGATAVLTSSGSGVDTLTKVIINIDGNVNLSAGTWSLNNSSNAYAEWKIKGNINITGGTLQSGNSGWYARRTLNFVGGGTQNFSVSSPGTIGTATTTFKVSNYSIVQMNFPFTLMANGALNLENGKFITSTGNLITIPATGKIIGGNSSSYVDGPLAIVIASANLSTKTFPIGKGAAYRPVVLNVNHDDATPTTYTAEMFNTVPSTRTLPSALNSVSGVRYYNITKGTGATLSSTLGATVQLSYDADDLITDSSIVRVAKDDGSGNWLNLGGSGTASNVGTITSNAFHSFSDFALAIADTATHAVAPTVATNSVSYISTTFASSGGNVTNDGGAPISARGVCWNTSSSPTISDYKTTDGVGAGIFSSFMSGLTPGQTYYIRSYATNSAGTGYGTELVFSTLLSVTPPAVTTTLPTNIQVTTAISGGNVSDWGGDSVTVRGVCWNTTGNPTVSDNHSIDGNGLGSFASGLAPLIGGTTYYIRAYATNSSGSGYGNELSFITQIPQSDTTVVVAKDGSGDYTTVQAAFRAVPSNYTGKWRIFVKNGIYYEKDTLTSGKINVILEGENRDNTIITYDDYGDRYGSGVPGTSGSFTIAIDASDFVAKNITFQNTYAPQPGVTGTQAVALRTQGDRHEYINCKILGYQDTYYTWGGNGTGRMYHRDCLIEGTVDFIFGRNIVVFDNCTIHEKRNAATITAASTDATSQFGYVFRNCTIVSDSIGFDGVPITSTYLGRPWQASPRTVFINTLEPASINPAGWQAWNVTPCLYSEFNCYGPGSGTSGRVAWSSQLTGPVAATYALSNIFAKNSASSNLILYNWMPASAISDLPLAMRINSSAGSYGSISPSGMTNVAYNGSQTYTITPIPGYHVQDVLIDGISVGNSETHTISNVTVNHTISATFEVSTYTLNVNALNGTVTKDPDQTAYYYGESILLTAIANSGYHFVNWSGSISSTANPTTVIMDSNKNVTANFAATGFTLTVNSIGNGTVEKNPDLALYNENASVELTAIPDHGWIFSAWSGNATGSVNPLDVVMDEAKSITATFILDPLYQVMYRSFDPDSIAGSKDLKTKYKYIARKANACEFEFDLTAPQSV